MSEPTPAPVVARPKRIFWPWVSRLAFETLAALVTKLEKDVAFERTRWVSLVNAERARADKWEGMYLSQKSPSGHNIAFPTGASKPRGFRPIRGDELVQRLQAKSDAETAAGGDWSDPVPGMTDPAAAARPSAGG